MIRSIVGLVAIAVTLATHAGRAQQARVQVGYCTPLRNVAAAKASGFDYVELGTTEIAGLAEADFERAAQDLARIGLPTPVANLFLPATLKVTGPATDRVEQTAYVTNAFDRLS